MFKTLWTKLFGPQLISSYEAERRRLVKIYQQQGPMEFQVAVVDSWGNPQKHGELFGFCASDRNAVVLSEEPFQQVGCLTQIHRAGTADKDSYFSNFAAPTPALTTAIRMDHRIRNNADEIMLPDELAVYVEWQLRLDKELGRKTPMVAA